jgi:hypothetical protein
MRLATGWKQGDKLSEIARTRPGLSAAPRTVCLVVPRMAPADPGEVPGGGGITSLGTVPSLTGSATRRRRALAHLSPIFDLHLSRNRNSSAVDWLAYDFISLIQGCIDVIAMSSGLDGNLGTPRSLVLGEMSRMAAAMAPFQSTEEHEHVARHVLDHLLRHDHSTPYFAVQFSDPDNNWQPEIQQVRVLYETLAPDGATLHVNADNAAVALLLIATNRSLEDEHEAVIAVMRAQAESGRLDAAMDSAEDALTLSRTYSSNVRRLIAEAERDVARVDYLRVLRPELMAAAQHLDRRISVDGTLLRHLEGLRADASEEHDPAAVRHLSVAASRLGMAVEVLAGLQTDVISASPRWRDAQAAQAFTAVPESEIDPTSDVLSALLNDCALPHGRNLSPPAPQVVLNFTAMADRLAAAPRLSPEGDGQPIPEEPLDAVDGVYEQFPVVFHDVAHVLRSRRIPPGGKARLSDLLADADKLLAGPATQLVADLAALAGARETARRRLRLLLALDALMLWRPDGVPDDLDDWWSVDDGARAAFPDLDVPDLLVHKKGGGK